MAVDHADPIFLNPRRRPSHAELTERLDRARTVNGLLRLEIRSVRAENAEYGSEIAALSRRIELAITAERPDVAMHVAGRLADLAASLSRKGSA